MPQPNIADRMRDISNTQTNKFMVKNGYTAKNHTIAEGVNL